MDAFEELLARVKEITGLDGRKASAVAGSLYDRDADAVYSAAQIVREAKKLGYEFEERERVTTDTEPEPEIGPEISMDPARVLSEVYENCPRVLCAKMPTVGRAPNEAYEHFADLIESLPEEVRALLVKLDLYEGKATFWLRDDANEIDRPIGPIDLRGYADAEAIEEAFMALLQRLPRVLAADFN
jgi:hypothetical protein